MDENTIKKEASENVVPEAPVPMPESPEATKESAPEVGEPNIVAQKELRDKIESTPLPSHLHQQAHDDFQAIASLDATAKLQKLMRLAQHKGVVYAVDVAKRMKDAYILDAFHDMLAKEGLYKEFVK